MLTTQHAYGCKFSARRDSDKRFLLLPEEQVTPPTLVDHRPQMPLIYDQGQLGSCVHNAVAADIEACLLAQGFTDTMPARLFNYYNARAIEHTVDQDSGSTIRDGILAAAKFGYVPESQWPYDISKFTVKPSPELYAEGKTDVVKDYGFVPQDLPTIKAVLAAGHNIVIGFGVYQSFETKSVAMTGIMPVPNPKTEQLLGGHGVLVVGYNDAQQWAIVRNSWSAAWGAGGYFYMPYSVLTNPALASDFWTIRTVKKVHGSL